MTLNKKVKAWCLFLGTFAVIGSGWTVYADSSTPHRIPVSGYDFAVGFDGHLISASDNPAVKSVDFSSTQAEGLQREGSMAWTVVVEGSADPGITLDYLAFFDPFYTESIFGSADVSVFPVEGPESCSIELDASEDNANMFSDQKVLTSTDPTEPSRNHYCVVAQAPTDKTKLDVFTTSDPSAERGATLNFRHAAN